MWGAHKEPRLISVMLRTVRANQVIAVFQAVRGAGDKLLPPAALQAADPNATEASLCDVILGSATPKTEPPSTNSNKSMRAPSYRGRFSVWGAILHVKRTKQHHKRLQNLTKNMLKPHERFTSMLYYLSKEVGNVVAPPGGVI
jgi:hypothetical protein